MDSARPQKRRRISVETAEEAYSYRSNSSPPTDNEHPLQTTDITSVSRIKTRISNGKSKPSGNSHIPVPTPTTTSSTFGDLGVAPWLQSSLSHLSIISPTPIQASCVPPLLSGRSCIGSSQTGSGKTLAFALPILQQWAENPCSIFALILTPTRELALQIHEQIIALGSRRGLRCALVTGGADARQQALELSRKPHIVVATPGRLADHVANSGEETVGGLRRCKYVVLDEADRLLAGGGRKGSMLDDLETCLSLVPPPAKRQTLLFTATVTPEVRALKDMPRPEGKEELFECELSTEDSKAIIPKGLKQTYQLVNLQHKEKYLHILLLTPLNVEKKTLIFVNHTSTATLLERLLRLLDHRVTSLHSALTHTDRVSNLARFRAHSARILIATDVASRGLDIPEVGLVINYDLPRDPDTYIHRIGRTARAGRKGTSISLVGVRDVELVHAIEARVESQMEEYAEDGVSVEGRVLRDALSVVGEKKREAILDIEEGRDVRGKRRRDLKAAKRR